MSHAPAGETPSRDPGVLPDLPPVEPPSAGFIVQLFVIPAAIVAVVVVVWLLFGKLAGGERPAMDYVQTIENESANRRFRAAYELANLIRNTDSLARDPELLGRLNSLLARELSGGKDESVQNFLALSLGEFKILETKGSAEGVSPPLETLARAVEPGHPTPVRIAGAMSLAKHAARLENTLDDPKAIAALVAAGTDPDVELRQVSAFALGFFAGEPASAALRERLGDEDRSTRYNAAVALGRKDDPAAVNVLREMLTPEELERTVVSESPDEKRSRIEALELEALQALLTSTKAGHSALAETLKPQLMTLSKSGLVGVRTNASEVLKILQAAG
jgi:hypothetical protein